MLFAATVTVWFRVALRFGRPAAVTMVAALLLYPAFSALFHRYSSDAITGFLFALLALALTRSLERPSAGRWAVAGAAIAVIALTRPANQVLVLCALLPLLAGGRARARLRLTGICALVAILPLLAWTGANSIRYDDLALSRGGGGWLPFYRAYLTDGLVDPANGPASRELAELVERELLPREPYRSYGITLEKFFQEPSARYHEDMISLSDRYWGWDTDYAKLRAAALEGIRRHPFAFAADVARSGLHQLTESWALLPAPVQARVSATQETVVVGDRELPRPTEGGPIPAASRSHWLARPDNAFDEVWTSPTDHHVVATRPELLRDFDRLNERVAELSLPAAWSGWFDGARALNRLNRLYPPALVWLAVGLVAIAVRRPARAGLALALAGAALAVIAATLLSVPPVAEFLLPLFPAFALLGIAGLLGPRRDPEVREEYA